MSCDSEQVCSFIVLVAYVLRRLRSEKLRSDVETHVFFKMEVGHTYSKINWRTDPTDSLETHSMKVLYKTSPNESTVVNCKKVIYFSTKGGGGRLCPPPFPPTMISTSFDVNVFEAILSIQRFSIWPKTETRRSRWNIHCSLSMHEFHADLRFDTIYGND